MDLDQLKTFVELANLRNYSKTAINLHISQPTVSSRMKSLEEELNQKLFQRNGKELKLTSAGEYFYDYAQEFVARFEETEVMLREFSSSEFSVGASPLCANYCLTHIFPELQNHPQYVPMNIRTVSHPHQLLEMLSKGIIDVAVLSSFNYNFNYTAKNCELLWKEPTALIASPGHPITRHANPVSLEVAQYPVALLGSDNATYFGMQLLEIFKESGIDFSPHVKIDNYNVAKRLMRQGSLISFLPLLCMEEEIENGQFINVPYEYSQQLSSSIYLFYRPSTHEALFKHFYSLLKEFAERRKAHLSEIGLDV